MKLESAVFAVAGMCFGIILGWVIGAQQARSGGAAATVAAPAAPAAQSAQAGGNTQRQAPALDEAKVQSLTTILQSDPKNASAIAAAGEHLLRRRALDRRHHVVRAHA